MSFELDADSLGVLYGALSEQMLVFFTRRCYDAQMAVDLVGETFARAYQARGRFAGGTRAEAEGWLWGIARNVLADSVRRGRAERRALARLGVQAPRLDEDELGGVEQLAGLADLRVVVASALERLSAAEREAVRLRVVEELDYRAVAAALGISQPAARARVSRALRSLGDALDVAEGLG
jgi:RNA polymerase sigma-70 factor (ECF subfamily)